MMKWFMRISGSFFIAIACVGLYLQLDPLMGGIISAGGILLVTAQHEGKI